MKTFVLLLLVAVFSANAAPSSKFEEQGPVETTDLQSQERDRLVVQKFDRELSLNLPVEESEHGDRFRRVTCDLLSFSTKFGSLNHSACAAHCLAMRKGYKGGRCSKGVCRCRK